MGEYGEGSVVDVSDAAQEARHPESSSNDSGLVLDSVTKAYGSSKVPALHNISLNIAHGQFVTIIGPSGCGKSTLLRIIAGLERQDNGAVSIFGESVDRAQENKHIGYVPQSLALLAWRTVLDNVRLPLQ